MEREGERPRANLWNDWSMGWERRLEMRERGNYWYSRDCGLQEVKSEDETAETSSINQLVNDESNKANSLD